MLKPWHEFGLGLRAQDEIDSGYLLTFLPLEGIVRLGNQEIVGVDGLGQWFTLEVVVVDDLIDVCVDGRRTLVNRCVERDGLSLFFFAQNAEVSFEIEKLEVFARD